MGKRILFVDDEPVFRIATAMRLGMEGYTVVESENGREALERFGQGSFDLVITDLQMPELNGIELAARIKALSPQTPVIIVTGHSEKLTGCGVSLDGVLAKPFEFQELRRAIDQVLAGSNQGYRGSGEKRG